MVSAMPTPTPMLGPMLGKDFPGGAVVKNLPASAGYAGDMGSIPGSGRSSIRSNYSILAWTIP